MNLIFQIFCFSLLFLEGSFKMIFKCTGMVGRDAAVVNENDQLVCSCSDDDNAHSFLSFLINGSEVYDDQIPFKDINDMIFEKSYDNKTFTFKKNEAAIWDRGYYTCFNSYYTATIYIWVKTKKSFFSTVASVYTGVINSRRWLRIPCVPSSPCYDVKLFKDSQEIKINKTNGIEFDPRKGFIITNPSYIYVPINYTCSITLDGRTESFIYHYTEFD